MNLLTTIAVYAGGPGSGCHGENCGRPKSGLQEMLESVVGQFPKSYGLWGKLVEFGHPGNVGPFSKEELRELKPFKAAARQCKVGFCYMNAQRLAIAGLSDKRLQYVEGLVTVHGVPLDHAWVEFNGKVYDPTIAEYKAGQAPDYTKGGKRSYSSEDKPEYFGIAVPKELIMRHQLNTRTYNPLSHAWHNEELMQKIWRKDN